MKIYPVLFFFILSLSRALAQVEVNSLELESKPHDVISSRDQNGNYFFLFQYGKSYQMVILDSNYKELKRQVLKKTENDSRKNTLIGTIFDERGAVAYMVNSKTEEYSAMRIDRNTGAVEFLSLGKLDEDDYFLKAIELDGKFHILAVPRQENELKLYTTDYGNPFLVRNFKIDFPTFYTKLTFHNEELNQKSNNPVGIEYIRYDIDQSIKTAHPFKKLYAFNGKIYIVIDDPTSTHVITINPEAGTSNYKKLNFSLDKDLNTNARQGNSFFYRGDLFRATLSSKQLNLSVIYLDSTMLLRAYNFYPDKTIELVNGVIVQNAMDGQDRIIHKTSQFFNRLLDGRLSISVTNLNDGRYELQLGSYEEITTYRNGGSSSPGGLGIPGLSIGFGLGYGFGFGLPYYDPFYYPNAGGSTVTKVQLCYFESLIRQSDLEHLEGTVPRSASKKIEEYTEKNFRSNSPELLQLMAMPDGVLMGLYSKNNGKYKLMTFKRD